MPEYRIEFAPSAYRRFVKLPDEARRRLAPVIDALAGDPFPPGAKRLSGEDGLYRVRSGAYRVVYRVEADVLVVAVTPSLDPARRGRSRTP